MCGIYASISAQSPRSPSEAAKQLLCKRGPDHVGESKSQIVNHNGETCHVSLLSTVLAMRDHLVSQPFIDPSSGSCLCWNGEAWKIGTEEVNGNDGEAVFDALMEASSAQSNAKSSDDVLNVLRSIAGPFAFVYFDNINGAVYFGRDRLGRRSMLFRRDSNNATLELSSIADPSSTEWKEIEVENFYQLSYHGEQPHPDSVNKMPELSVEGIGTVCKHVWTTDISVSPSAAIKSKRETDIST